jgi:hypothetical protein
MNPTFQRLPSTTSLQNPALTDYQNLPLIDSSSSLKPLYAYPATASRRVAPTFSPSSSVHASPPSTVPHSTISPIRASPGHSTASTLSPPQEPITVLEQRRLSPPRNDTFRSTSDVNVLQVESQVGFNRFCRLRLYSHNHTGIFAEERVLTRSL